ncbi:MAG: hypothetical protein AAFR61_28015 [Bacteroidota bacterium]
MSRFLLLLCLAFWACSPQATQEAPVQDANPAAEGFDLEHSDPQAIAIADEVMEAMGGFEAWANTSVLQWTFFGRRQHWWNKQSGDVRIVSPRDSMVYLYNLFSKEGSVYQGKNALPADSLPKYLKRAESIWINDSYWLVMPFKLKDSGVTLTYIGEDTTLAGVAADVLELRFKEVGDTPQNKYQVWVEKAPRLITQWSFYRDVNDTEPGFVTPWIEYQTHGEILLSGNRGEGRALGDIAVLESVAEGWFQQP